MTAIPERNRGTVRLRGKFLMSLQSILKHLLVGFQESQRVFEGYPATNLWKGLTELKLLHGSGSFAVKRRKLMSHSKYKCLNITRMNSTIPKFLTCDEERKTRIECILTKICTTVIVPR